jgi:hypothetical protein
MPPALAALLTVAFVLFLLVRDSRSEPRTSAALWIPVLWLVVTGSRFVSQWLALGQGGADSSTDGSPLDAAYFLGLIVAAGLVLARRQLSLAALIRANVWLSIFMLYGLLAVLWSDFPLVASKRWIKTLGHPLMALIILTDPTPVRALGVVMKRCAYLLLPTSVLFIKYYPEYGRGFDGWTGQPMNMGVQLNKNGLGYLCMVLGLFFVWRLAWAIKDKAMESRRYELLLCAGFVYMAGWLLYMSDSKTSLVGTLVGSVLIVGLALKWVNPRRVGATLVGLIIVLATAEFFFQAYEEIILMLGRNPTLTDRTEVWADALALQPNPLIGAGFESFWLGHRLDLLWEKWWWQPNQSHNGYIETYLNLGYVGVVLLGGVLLSTFVKSCRALPTEYAFSTYRLSCLFAILVFNYTEAAFKGVHMVWTLFFIVALEYPQPGHRERVVLDEVNGDDARGTDVERLTG